VKPSVRVQTMKITCVCVCVCGCETKFKEFRPYKYNKEITQI